MADDGYRQDYPQQSRPEENQTSNTITYPHHHRQPLAGDRQAHEAPTANMATSLTLPAIHDARPRGSAPPSLSPRPRAYAHPMRYDSPTAANGYPPPGQHQQQPPPQHPSQHPSQHQPQHPPQHQPQHPPQHQPSHPPQHGPQQSNHQPNQPPGQQPPAYLPPFRTQPEPRSPAYPSPDPRGYYDDRRPAPYSQEQYPPDAYYGYRGPSGPPPAGYRDYRAPYASGVYEYPPGGPGSAPQLTQAAPRQRTSIACRYCRKRKIRCSGYQSAPGGKCQNCARMNQECIFQPVSSSSSTAFIPVSAVPGGVPPGTQLFGAYGQPLGASGQGPPGSGPHQHPQQHPQGPYQQLAPPIGYYNQQPVQSPTDSFSSYGEARNEETAHQLAGRRRRRTSEEQEESYRLPPPRPGNSEEDSRRRSPAEFSNHSSPNGLSYAPYPGARESPRNVSGGGVPQPSPIQGGISPTVKTGSSGASTPARQGQGQGASQQTNNGRASVMSLSNLVEKTDVDRTMIDRLNTTKKGKRREKSRDSRDGRDSR
ncbi:hypothetical protein G7046_g270 [Stylonectria norvegica]|nr:hypothetical protein G7046_g270 [Stylonectria norvegica]